SCSRGPALNPVQGKVIYKDQPLKGAVVTFHPKEGDKYHTVRPVGLTNEDGTFTLKTGEKDGAPAGEYVVTFICSELTDAPAGTKIITTGAPETRDRLEGAYANAATSNLKITIRSGNNQLEPFQLK